jgi:uncharacterized metal-binding protein YceD (DUF177 family)
MVDWRRVNRFARRTRCLRMFYKQFDLHVTCFFSYIESAQQLEHETNLDVSKYDVCDNIDLETIIQEYESVQSNVRVELVFDND